MKGNRVPEIYAYKALGLYTRKMAFRKAIVFIQIVAQGHYSEESLVIALIRKPFARGLLFGKS